MQAGGARNARFAGLAGHVHRHPERFAQHAGREHAAHAAELDGLEAHPARRLVVVVAPDVGQAVNAFVRADRQTGIGRRDRRHAGDVVGRDRLLEESQSAAGNRADILHGLLGAPSRIGIGGDQATGAENLADAARALAVGDRLADPDLDLEGRKAGGLLGGRVAQVGRELAVADDAEDRDAVANFAAQQRVSRPRGGAPHQIMQRDLDRRLGGVVGIHAAVHRRRGAGDVLGQAALQDRGQVRDGRHHAFDGLAGHGRRRGGLAPPHHAGVGFDPHQHIVGLPDLDARHEDRLLHRQRDRDRFDPRNFHWEPFCPCVSSSTSAPRKSPG